MDLCTSRAELAVLRARPPLAAAIWHNMAAMSRLAVFAAAWFAALTCFAQERPNFVFILADDMGYGDVHALNPSSKIPTPNLDRLAADGMTFTDAHTGSAVCTPTRYGLVTGRYSWRGRLKHGVLDGYGAPLIEDGRATIGSFLRAAGYATGIVGKWHLGLGFARTADGQFDFAKPVSDGPHTRGFDFSYVIPASLDFPPYLYVRNGEITQFPSIEQAAVKFPAFLRKGPRGPNLVMEDVLDDLAREAGGFISRQAKAEKPFLLYLPLTAPHKPVLPHRRFHGKTELGPYGDFVVQVDDTVGQVLASIEEAGVTDNTLVIYTSDNGSFMFRRNDPDSADHVSDETIQAYRASHHTSNGEFRGTKADVWEGGHHVPFFARWPGVVKAGSRTDATICLTDFFATAAEVVGAALPDDAAEDSFSLLGLLKGGNWKEPRAPVIHHSAAGMFAIRDGNWKLVAGNGSGGREQPKGKPFARPYALFDLSSDLGETKNLVEQLPDVASRLEEQLTKLRESGRSR